MRKVWKNDSKAGCVHPGWTILRSWEAIMQSWENVFDPNDSVDVKLSDVKVQINGNAAWLTCTQEMIYVNRNPISFNLSQATNIFEKDSSKWLMIIHHASPIPMRNNNTNYENLQ